MVVTLIVIALPMSNLTAPLRTAPSVISGSIARTPRNQLEIRSSQQSCGSWCDKIKKFQFMNIRFRIVFVFLFLSCSSIRDRLPPAHRLRYGGY
jgi:hypothetical protein